MKKPQLFLLHFAGGNAWSFDFLKPYLQNFDVVVPELPGRGKRMAEPLLTEFSQGVADVYQHVTGKLSGPPFFIYGHSMGAYLTLKLGHMLEQNGYRPAALIVSGNAGPHPEATKKKYYRMPHHVFLKELEELGGIPPDILSNPEYFEYFEPMLRADFELSEEHGLIQDFAVKAPIYAMMGTEEEGVGNIANWQRFTASWFRYETLPGGHFFIHHHPERIAAVINYCYRSATNFQHL
ncbi:thioesterase II family protein [Chitinophaga solisilvae]|uniref:thioesterase II family protein n=1 Tax=Chitinophaga solisilvae TaxID=1233460 RepID=UPI00136C92EF|nr:alpha/beta fold hydrolase [Chitinophaga solisilvae]